MSRYGIARPTAIAAAAATLVALSAAARAAAPDCTKIDAAAAATVLGVPKARNNSSGGHTKQSPDNMDVLGCTYAEISPDPMARTLTYFIYTPIPKDLESVFSSLTNENVRGAVVKFSPGVGTGSTGWTRSSASGETFDGSVVVRGNAYIAVAKVGGMPSLAAAKKALVSAGQILAKP
jgi:uncharacterized membrane protein